ncbi:hypothetical protein LYNGBM3L_37380 [Moorena producens 3L]|uniref:Uncharacterized protein n=1 Tax=Moorena producens 3L TaxID=489825 RepID=F4XPZ6_9CYAN|nr:hypothetical protein LYNGBM3L_37380 [Moorena producens 3L]
MSPTVATHPPKVATKEFTQTQQGMGDPLMLEEQVLFNILLNTGHIVRREIKINFNYQTVSIQFNLY